MARQKQFNFRVIVDRDEIQPLAIAHNINLAAKVGMKASADHLRDMMRAEYNRTVYEDNDSLYQQNSGYRRTTNLSKFIVTHATPTGGFEVGAKEGQIVGHQYISEIFGYMDQGTSALEPWTFHLEGARAGNSNDEFITTYGQEGKGFISEVARQYGITGFNLDSAKFTKNAVDAMLNSKKELKFYGGVKI